MKLPLVVLCVALSVCPSPPAFAEDVRAVVLGIAQDGGVPHIGCTEALCVDARRDPSRRQRVAALGADSVPVYATERMVRFLRQNAPWSELVANRHLALVQITPGDETAFGNLRVTAIAVPHRDELSDTVGYRVRGPGGAVNRLLTEAGARAATADGIVAARDGDVIPLSAPGTP